MSLYDHLFRDDRSNNLRARMKALTFYVLALLIPVLLVINFLARNVSKDVLDSFLGFSGTEALLLYLV